MESSGVDLNVFKKRETSIKKEEVIVQPIKTTLDHTFKKDASKVANLLTSRNPTEIEASFKKQGFYMIDSFKIYPNHIRIVHKTVENRGRRFIPHVVEPSFGSDRLVYATLEYAYRVKNGRTLLSLPQDIAPYQVGVFPLVNKDGLPEKAKQVHKMLLNKGFLAEYDESGSIGRRYARSDEVGIPLGITVDYQTLKDNTVTLRNRDTWQQVRKNVSILCEQLQEFFGKRIVFEELGQPLKK
jgi:glycyl-tRNA synthetase